MSIKNKMVAKWFRCTSPLAVLTVTSSPLVELTSAGTNPSFSSGTKQFFFESNGWAWASINNFLGRASGFISGSSSQCILMSWWIISYENCDLGNHHLWNKRNVESCWTARVKMKEFWTICQSLSKIIQRSN